MITEKELSISHFPISTNGYHQKELSCQILSDLIVYMKYAKYIPELERRETWDELVLRNQMMHMKKYPDLISEIDHAYDLVRQRKILPSMRSMQFAGKPIELSPARLYNCCFMPMDHFLCFSELMFLLLSGCGVGFSVQSHHVNKLPEIRKPHRKRRYLIGDSIEGWADSVKSLIRSYLDNRPFPVFDYCIDPETRVLKADLTWDLAKNIKEDDDLIGFDEKSERTIRKLRKARVERTTRIIQPRLKIVTDRGTIITSETHGFLLGGHRGTKWLDTSKWVYANELKSGDTIRFLSEPWEVDDSRDGGWLAGFLDGEGWTIKGAIGVGQNNGSTLNRAVGLLENRKFVLTAKQRNKLTTIYINGGKKEGMRLLGSLRPHRLLEKLGKEYWEGMSVNGRGAQLATVYAIEPLGDGEVIGIKTSTNTLITEGMLTHNSDIRPKGSPLKTAGGKAPGPEPLRLCLERVQSILESKPDGSKLTSLEVHDINCHIADAVLSGGIRRSSMISLFDVDDELMLEAKHGEWWIDNPQRALANNSAVIVRHKVKKEIFDSIWNMMHLSNAGEPGFFFTNDKEFGINPCAEVSLRPYQFCNLTTINVSNVENQDDLNERARAAAFIATLQAGYTDFHYLREVWKSTTEKEALIGVSMTGIASHSILSLDLKEAAAVVKKENERVAKMIGINKAARCTVVKPEGTTSLLLGSSSGVHSWHADYYIRRMRVLKNESIYHYFSRYHPELLEDDQMKPERQAIISIPIKAPDGAITRQETALELLSRVSRVWEDWVREGHRKGDNVNNVSTTVSVREGEWEDVKNWMWENRDRFTALSVLPYDGGSYVQAPFEEIDEFTYHRLVSKLLPVDFSAVKEYQDETSAAKELACAGNACEVI